MRRGMVLAGLLVASAGMAQDAAQDAGAPLSAIDWLSQSVTAQPVAAPAPVRPVLPAEEPVANSAATPQITVTPLDRPSPDGIGLLPPEVTGLPRTLWSASQSTDLMALIQPKYSNALPALDDLLVTLLLAEADPPQGSGAAGPFLLARIDKLLDLGALEPARALLNKAGVADPRFYRRWFDVSILTGTEDLACEELRTRPALAPTYPARVFCMARNGDWTGAALTLNTARALGDVTDEEDALLSRFLDPAIADESPALPPPTRLSPLVFLMREAIGEAIPTAGLPLAFAHADLRPTAAWRNQMEAAERLARSGAVSSDVLRDVYMLRRPAASGGVWDRAEAIQRFDTALAARDPGAVSATLPPAWEAMTRARIEVPFARLYAPALAGLPLSDEAAGIARTVTLLSGEYEAAVLDWEPADPDEALLRAVALGDMSLLAAPPEAADAAAIHAAFSAAPVPAPLDAQLTEGKLGEAILNAIAALAEGQTGDHAALSGGLATLRAVGLEDAARRIALQYLLLDRPS